MRRRASTTGLFLVAGSSRIQDAPAHLPRGVEDRPLARHVQLREVEPFQKIPSPPGHRICKAPRGYVLLEERGVDGQRSIRDGDSVIGG